MSCRKVSLVFLFYSIIFIFNPYYIAEYKIPEYRVVIDAGHGGISLNPIYLHGDRYDLLSRKYIDSFAQGASYKGVFEHQIAYEIANKVNKLLSEFSGDRKLGRLYFLLKKYFKDEPKRIKIKLMMGRGDSRNRSEIRNRKDPNGEFRIFDYPDSEGNMLPGRISRINKFKPHLVVSLHCDYRAPIDRRGINPVIVAPPWLLFDGLRYLKGEIKSSGFFWNSEYTMWFVENTKRSAFQWFLNDTSLYFTGYRVRRDNNIDLDDFMGYKHNMVSWKYADKKGWDKEAWNHKDYTSYSKNYNKLQLNTSFWKREKLVWEQYRRGSGPEGYGGDNCYASKEIIRYIISSLEFNNLDHKKQKMGAPYISVWSLPLYVNAISAYIELGYLYDDRFRKLFTERQDEISEGIAVGIYSLLVGPKLKEREKGWKDKPKAIKLDLNKYRINDRETYFDIP